MNKLPVIYLTIDEDHETGLDAISLVDHPAIERNWMAFNKQHKFALNEEKRIVSGAAMVADYPIYRRDEDGREYYVVFDSDAIRKIVKIKTLSGETKNLNVPAGTQHEDKLKIKGAGIKDGDHVAIAKIKIPQDLTPKEKDLIEEFQKIRKDQ